MLVTLALGQALAAAMLALCTRAAFAAMHAAQPIPPSALWAMVGAGLLGAACKTAEHRQGERLGQAFIRTVRERVYGHLARMPVHSVRNKRHGALIMRFSGDMVAVRAWVSLGLPRTITAAAVLPMAIGVLVVLSPTMAAAATAWLALGLLGMWRLSVRLTGLNRAARRRRVRLASDMSERIVHAPELHAMGRTAQEIRHLRSMGHGVEEVAVRKAHQSGLLRSVPNVFLVLASAFTLWLSVRHGIDPATVAACLATLGVMAMPLRDLATAWDRYDSWRLSRRQCVRLLSQPGLKRHPRPAPRPSTPDALAVRVQDARLPHLAPLNLHLPAGEKLVLSGPNGAGKSAVLHLLAGMETPQSGRVRLGGRSPLNMGAAERRRAVSYLSPRSPILAGSLRRALTLGQAQRAPDDDIRALADAFGLGSLLQRLGGLDGQVREDGRNLSCGERTRILMVRACLTRPQVLLLDNLDTGLDAAGQQHLVDLVHRIPSTVIVATHQPDIYGPIGHQWELPCPDDAG